jgi:hypothetical protein
MSQAFIREGDEMWLGDIAPTIDALINYLSRENGLRITEKSHQFDKTLNTTVYKMSDGFNYFVKDNKWVCQED